MSMSKINIQHRDLSKKTEVMRKEGMIPGVIFGPTIENEPIELSSYALEKIMEQGGEIYKVPSKKGDIFVKFDEIQRHPLTRDFIHFSLVQLPKGVENEITIPINLSGEPIGVKNGGVLVVMKDEVTVRGMPRDIPKEIKGSIEALDIGDKITLADLKISKDIEFVAEDHEVVATCTPPTKAEEEEESVGDEAQEDTPAMEASSEAESDTTKTDESEQ